MFAKKMDPIVLFVFLICLLFSEYGVSLHGPSCPQDSPTSASPVLGLQASTTIPNLTLFKKQIKVMAKGR